MIRIGVTGTDTGVGKTVVAERLIEALRRRGVRVGAMKPVETGIERGAPGSDAERLWLAAGSSDPMSDVCPIALPEPLAPWVAATRAGRDVSLSALDAAYARVTARRDAVVVEGAGGVLVPFTREETFASLCARWSLSVVVVAANRLGAINHTLLTVEALRAAGVPILGVVLNDIAPADDLAAATNLEALRTWLAPLPVIPFPHAGSGGDEEASDALAALVIP